MSHPPHPKLESLPVEVIIDNILPLLPVSSIASLSATSKFFYLLASDETFWKRRLLTDYNFSGNDTARTTGWKFIYGRLARPKVYVWGEGSRRRLGFKPRDLPRTSVYEGVPYPVQLHLPRGVKIVSLSAGGMSFHALDSQGRVWVWGTLDGTSFLTQADSFADKHKPAASPTLLELPFSIRTISCGRLHSAALTTSSQVLNFTSWGRPFVLHSRHFTSSLASLSPSTHSSSSSSTTNTTNPTLQTHIPPSTPIQVECGWAFTAVLTSSGNVFVYWPHENGRDRLGRLIFRKNEEWNAQGVGLAKLQGDDSSDNDFPRIPCHVWHVDVENPDDAYIDASGRVVRVEGGMIMVKLPDLEEYDLPKISTDGQDGEEDKESTKIVKIAGLDNAVVGLTNKGHVVMFRGLEGQETAVTPGNRWRYLPYFSEVEKVREDPMWTDEKHGLQPPEKMKISHISGNYKTFTTYSPNPGVVLMGNIDSDPSLHHPLTTSTIHPLPPPSPFKPTILPTLQHPHNTVISVVLGDYHYGALTSSGHLLTWGSFSKGALGLGDPNDLDVGVPGGFGSQQEKDESLREARLRRYGIEPERTEVPGVVRFDWEDRKRGAKGKERYCFGATAAGWHMGALVIDLEPDTEEEETEEEHPEANMPGAFPDSDTPAPEEDHHNVPVIPLLGRGINPFRIGFAGRAGRGGPHGMYRPLGRGNVPDEA